MTLNGYAQYPLPDLAADDLLASMPIMDGIDGPLYDRRTPCDHNDRLFAEWDTPLVWHHQPSQVKLSKKFHGKRAVHFAFEDRVPKDVWDKNWTLWYDHALMTRKKLPADILLTGTFGIEEVSTGLGADNMELSRPWAGIVARMQDLRRYYFLTLEYPGRVVLYRRDDHQWTEIAWAQVHFDVFRPYRLTLTCRGSQFKAWFDDHFLFDAVDYGYSEGGYCGVRATCVAFVTDYSVRKLDGTFGDACFPKVEAPAKLPEPVVVRDLDLSELGPLSNSPRHHANFQLGHFVGAKGEPQLLIKCNHPSGANHALVDLHGKVIWRGTWEGAERIHALPAKGDGTCDLIAVGKELMRIDGTTGKVILRAPLPERAGARRINSGNGPRRQADFDGDGRVDTFFLTCGANDKHLWAVDHDLQVRWYRETPSGQGHGDHLTVCDVDRDGREEVLCGCAMLDASGNVRWSQEEMLRRLGCLNGGHVDCAQSGYFDGPEGIPLLHYQGSSAGHVVIDARNGAILAVHPQGHSQCGNAGRVIPGSEGVQVVSSNRWGGYGVTAIYDAVGNRLSRFQPGFTCQEATPINWTGEGHEHLLVCDGQGYRGIYDHLGRRLIDLDSLIPYATGAFEQRFDRTNTLNSPMFGGPCDDLLIRIGNRIRILSAKRPFAPGTKVYKPSRRGNVSMPGWVVSG